MGLGVIAGDEVWCVGFFFRVGRCYVKYLWHFSMHMHECDAVDCGNTVIVGN